MDLTNSLNVVFGNLPRDSPHEESLFTPPPDDPASPEKQFWVSVPPLPAGLTRDSYRTCPRSLKRARSKNAEKREYAKYDDETDQTTLSVGWLDEQLTELHTVQAVNLALRGFIVDMGAPNSSNHAFHGFPIPNHTQFNDMGDVKTCAMSGWDGLPSPRQPGPATKINRRKQKPVYTVFDSDTENRRSTSVRCRFSCSNPQLIYALSSVPNVPKNEIQILNQRSQPVSPMHTTKLAPVIHANASVPLKKHLLKKNTNMRWVNISLLLTTRNM